MVLMAEEIVQEVEGEKIVKNSETAKLTNWKNEPTVQDLKQDLQDALPDHTAQVSKIDTWLDNLFVRGSAVPKSKEGFSKVVPKLIRKQAEWRYASLSEPFLSTENLFDVRPVTWEDTEAAKQNALVLNNQVNTRINKVKFINEYVRAAVNEGTVIVKLGWNFKEVAYTVTEMQYEYRTTDDPNHIQAITQLIEFKYANPTIFMTEVPEHLQRAVELTEEHQIPIMPFEIGEAEVEKTETIANHPTWEVCDYNNVIIDPSCQGDIDKAGFVIYSFETSLAELKKEGKYKNLDKIMVQENSILSSPDSHQPGTESSFNFSDENRKRILAYEYWGMWDIDGTGETKPIVATFVGSTMIRLEENPFPEQFMPFVTVPYLPVKRSVYGEPDGELLEDNQKIIGAVTRGMIDIMGRSANGQIGYRKDALDVVNRRKFLKGEDYEYNPNVDPRQAFFVHTYPEIPASAQIMLQLQNNEAEALTGVKSFSSGISGQALGNTATGVRSALDATAKRDLDILRRLSAGLEAIGRKTIAMNAEFLEEEEVVRITNEQFQKVRRDDLKGRFDLKLSISTAETDNQKAQELAFMLQTAAQTLPFEMTQLILAEIADLRKMPMLAKKIKEYQPQPDPMAQRRAELELMKLEAEIMEIQANAQSKGTGAQLNQAKAGTELVKQGKTQAEIDQAILDFVEQESGVKQERDLQKAQAQAQGNMQLEALKAILESAKPQPR